jgi:hypothetical protein
MHVDRHDICVCQSCGLVREGSLAPSGWMGIIKYIPGRSVGLGFFCSAECLEMKVKILVKVERNQAAAREQEPAR